ncbi:hypothetical protein A3Q56_04914 [Intoshia linei]|uniref:C3H1-type domain-containing protein n=1 Tax=Intoshia linei TaxID=1819745 RepID=A0A177AZB9_9BILA|nr:hypothetical protein A3Q56_04914 [Intoshia linei]
MTEDSKKEEMERKKLIVEYNYIKGLIDSHVKGEPSYNIHQRAPLNSNPRYRPRNFYKPRHKTYRQNWSKPQPNYYRHRYSENSYRFKSNSNTLCTNYLKFKKCYKKNCTFSHDMSSIDCKQFMIGKCDASSLSCSFNHDISSNNMPTCVYYIKGTCTLGSQCNYRHINVSKDAPPCIDFIKSTCIEKDECDKFHSFVCHIYSETGKCPYGINQCPLIHKPTSQMKKVPNQNRPNKPDTTDKALQLPIVADIKENETVLDSDDNFIPI